MADHVAVLRERLKELAAKEGVCGQSDVRRLAFLDAIATCEQHAALVAENERLRDEHARIKESLDIGQDPSYNAAYFAARFANHYRDLQAKHAALVARLGELEKGWRDPDWLPADPFAAGFALKCADDLARVVKGGEGGR